jgi:hypothetical protein
MTLAEIRGMHILDEQTEADAAQASQPAGMCADNTRRS